MGIFFFETSIWLLDVDAEVQSVHPNNLRPDFASSKLCGTTLSRYQQVFLIQYPMDGTQIV